MLREKQIDSYNFDAFMADLFYFFFFSLLFHEDLFLRIDSNAKWFALIPQILY